MQAFRDIVKGWFGKCILAVIVLLFVLLGSEALLSLAVKPKPAVVVNGEEINRDFLSSRVEQQKQSILQQYRGQISPDMIDDDLLKSSVLEGLINRILVRDFLSKADVRVSKERLYEEIRATPDFQVDGQFSQDQFSDLVRRYGMTPAGYLEEVQFSLALESFQTSLRSTAFVTSVQAKQITQLEQQRRAFKYRRIDHEDFKDKVEIAPDAVAQYYEQNLELYTEPEAVKVDYVLFTEADVRDQVQVEEQDVLAAYEAYVENVRLDEQREAAHILIEAGEARDEDEARAKAQSLLEDIRGGADFAELARKHSDDVGSQEQGGALGEAGRGDFVPEFEAVLFALNPGQVSEVVRTEFGFHLIKLLKVKESTPETLEARRSTLEAQICAAMREEAFFELEAQVNELAFEMENLEVFESEFSKSVQTSDWIIRGQADTVFAAASQVSALFEDSVLEDGRNTQWISLDDKRGAIARLNTYRPEAPKPLSAVAAEIEQQLVLEAAADKAMQMGQDLIAALRSGNDLSDSDAAGAQATGWEQVELVDRSSAQAPFSVMSEVFSMPKPDFIEADAKPPVAGVKDGNDYMVIQLLEVEEAVVEDTQDDTQSVQKTLQAKRGSLRQGLAERELESFFAWLEEEADIVRADSL